MAPSDMLRGRRERAMPRLALGPQERKCGLKAAARQRLGQKGNEPTSLDLSNPIGESGTSMRVGLIKS